MSEHDTEPEVERASEDYEPPRVEDVPAEDRPAVTAAGATDEPLAAEWRRYATEQANEVTQESRQPDEQRKDYEPPRVEDVPAEDRPAVTAAGTTDARAGVEWRP